jgi:hypothetical protein
MSPPLLNTFRFPLWSPCKKKCSFSGTFCYMSLGVLSMGALPPDSTHRACVKRERCFPSKAFPDMSLRVPSKDTPLQVPLTKPLHRERCSISKAFFYIKSPAKESPFQVPLAELPQKETLHLQSLLLPVCQSPQ